MIMFTCNVCKNRQARTFSKDAYENGVVLIRCEGCDNLHLIADNLGWFQKEKINIEGIMKEKGKKVFRFMSKETLEFVVADKVPEKDTLFEEVDTTPKEHHECSGGCGGHDHHHEHECSKQKENPDH